MATRGLKKTTIESKLPVDDRYITVRAFCTKYSIGITKLYELMHLPDFPRIKIGGAVRIAEDTAHQWLMERASGSAL